jgi:hypothetical protein
MACNGQSPIQIGKSGLWGLSGKDCRIIEIGGYQMTSGGAGMQDEKGIGQRIGVAEKMAIILKMVRCLWNIASRGKDEILPLVYAALIAAGAKSMSDVPQDVSADAKQALNDIGLGHLAADSGETD